MIGGHTEAPAVPPPAWDGDALDVREAFDRLDAYGRTYGQLALRLLLHAAVPQTLRPDLVNLLRVNFLPEAGRDSSIDADLLFSPMCEHSGAGYYRLDLEVRRHCLALLDAVYSPVPELRSRRVARFLLAYVEACERRSAGRPDPLLREFLDIQRWVAIAFLDPARAAARFAEALQREVEAGAAAVHLRLSGLASALAVPLTGHAELIHYARGLDALVSGDVEYGRTIMERLGDREVEIGGIRLAAPTRVLSTFAHPKERPQSHVPLVRVFLSSPGDVAKERTLARQLIESELPKNRAFHGRLALDVIAWDDPAAQIPMLATETPQESVNAARPRPADCDIVIVILWSRMGTPLPGNLRKANGESYLSGTEWEYEDAVNSPRKPPPQVLVYRRTEEPLISLRDPMKKEKEEQFERVEAFFAQFRNADGPLKGGVNEYTTPNEFKVMLRQHLEELFYKRLLQLTPDVTGLGGTIFISYRRGADSGFAGRLYDRLEHSFGRQRVLMDIHSVQPGEDFVAVLQERVAECEILLALIGRGWLTATDDMTGQRRLDNPDDFVRIEITVGLAQGKLVIPVLIDDAPMPLAEDLPAEIRPLAHRQFIRLTHHRFKDDVERLIGELKRVLPDAEAARQAEDAKGTKIQEEKRQKSAPKGRRAKAEASRRGEGKKRQLAEDHRHIFSAFRQLLAHLRDVLAGNSDPQSRLSRTVGIIAEDMGAEVCSIYVRAGEVLELFATHGLRESAIHVTRFRYGEGLIGEIAATGRPLALADARNHPSFVYRPETGEEIYQSFMGVPILSGGRAIGVLAIQNVDRRQYTDEEIEVLQTVTMVLAELVEVVVVMPMAVRSQPETSDAIPDFAFRDVDAPWCPEMVALPKGEFLMGSPESEEGRHRSKWPQHRVTISYRFAVGRYPVTFEEYGYFCTATRREKPGDEDWGRGRRPVINVSWRDVPAYCKWLAEITGKPYRLPSEAEWEYACRAGTTTLFSFGETITKMDANFGRNVGKTTEVGAYPANPWGLYDMHGNVREWVEDAWDDSYEGAPIDGSAWTPGEGTTVHYCPLRGGSWLDDLRYLHSARRIATEPDSLGSNLGFRVARTLD